MKLKKKVCILTTVHPPFDGRIFSREARTIAKMGLDVSLVASHDKAEMVDGIRIVPLPTHRSRLSRIAGGMQVLRLALKEKADIYHFHDPELIPIGFLLKIFSKSKIVYDVHEDHPKTILTKYYLPKTFRRILAFFFNIIEKSACYSFDYIIFATEGIEKNFPQFAHKSSVVHNLPRKSYIGVRNAESEKALSKKTHTIICTGGFDVQYGIREAVESLGLIRKRNVRLLLIGKYQDSKFADALRRLPEYHMVEFMEWIPQKELFEHLFGAEIGLVLYHPLPYMVEALPTKIFEYMAAGIPILASNFPLWQSIVEGNGCGVTVDPTDPKKIAEKITYLIEHSALRKQMGENGRRAFIDRYNWDLEKQKMVHIFHGLLAN